MIDYLIVPAHCNSEWDTEPDAFVLELSNETVAMLREAVSFVRAIKIAATVKFVEIEIGGQWLYIRGDVEADLEEICVDPFPLDLLEPHETDIFESRYARVYPDGDIVFAAQVKNGDEFFTDPVGIVVKDD